MSINAIREACLFGCSSLTGRFKDRCAVWHQLNSLHAQSRLPSCFDFIIKVDVCKDVLPGLVVDCDDHSRVTALSGLPDLVKSEDGSVTPITRNCTLVWGGTLSPEVSVMDHLASLALHVPPRLVYDIEQDIIMPYADILQSNRCDRNITWTGGNLTGVIPEEWGQLVMAEVDFTGNQGLGGRVPTAWIDRVDRVRTYRTSLVDHPECDKDCFDPDLTGPQRDRCGIWHQLSRFEMRQEWLPPCKEYVMSNRDLCRIRWEQTIDVRCSNTGRVVMINLNPIMMDSLGLPVYILDPTTGGGGVCTAYFQSTLAPELSALDMLRTIYGEAPKWGFSDFIYGGALNQSILNCSHLDWLGNNLTGTIPAKWGQFEQLRELTLEGNRELSGAVPQELLRMKDDLYTGVYIASTNVELQVFNLNDRYQLCKRSQSTGGSLMVGGTDRTYLFSLNINKEDYNSSLMGPYSFSSSDVFYCGRSDAAVAHAVAVWCVFAVLLGLATATRAWLYRVQGRRQEQPKTINGRAQGVYLPSIVSEVVRLQCWFCCHRAVLAMCCAMYDLASDLLLAVSMYPSWTTWIIMAGFFLPEIVCSCTISARGVHVLKQHHTPALAYLLAPLLLLITLVTFPALLIYLLLARARKWPRPSGGRFEVWLGVDVDRLCLLYSGVTACTEDIITSIFTTIGYVIMAKSPWKARDTNIYFPVWVFWFSTVTSMVHMLLAWWDGIGNWLEYRNWSWAVEAFTCLYQPLPQRGFMKGALDMNTCDIETAVEAIEARCRDNVLEVKQGMAAQSVA